MYFSKFLFILPIFQSTSYLFTSTSHIIPQVRGQYSVFHYGAKDDIYRYKSKLRRELKQKLPFHVEDHHIIPQQFKTHKVILSTKFNINCSNNLLIMPGRMSKDHFPRKIVHQAHPHYNIRVCRYLDQIGQQTCQEERQYQLWLLVKHAENLILQNDDSFFVK